MSARETCHKRACYLRLEHADWKQVIFEIDANGAETFHDREPGEVRWSEFLPSERERSLVRLVLGHDKERSGGTFILDLDNALRRSFRGLNAYRMTELVSASARL